MAFMSGDRWPVKDAESQKIVPHCPVEIVNVGVHTRHEQVQVLWKDSVAYHSPVKVICYWDSLQRPQYHAKFTYHHIHGVPLTRPSA